MTPRMPFPEMPLALWRATYWVSIAGTVLIAVLMLRGLCFANAEHMPEECRHHWVKPLLAMDSPLFYVVRRQAAIDRGDDVVWIPQGYMGRGIDFSAVTRLQKITGFSGAETLMIIPLFFVGILVIEDAMSKHARVK